MSLTLPQRIRVADDKTNQALEELYRFCEHLAKDPWINAARIHDVVLSPGTAKTIKHGIGREPLDVLISLPVGPTTTGRFELVSKDTRTIVVKQTGFGNDVTVSLLVV